MKHQSAKKTIGLLSWLIVLSVLPLVYLIHRWVLISLRVLAVKPQKPLAVGDYQGTWLRYSLNAGLNAAAFVVMWGLGLFNDKPVVAPLAPVAEEGFWGAWTQAEMGVQYALAAIGTLGEPQGILIGLALFVIQIGLGIGLGKSALAYFSPLVLGGWVVLIYAGQTGQSQLEEVLNSPAFAMGAFLLYLGVCAAHHLRLQAFLVQLTQPNESIPIKPARFNQKVVPWKRHKFPVLSEEGDLV